jgi:DNA-binding protein
MVQLADVQSRLSNAQTRVDRAQSRLAETEERRDRAAEDDFNSWDLRMLEAKDTLMDHKLDLVKAKLQLAEMNGVVIGAIGNTISLAVEVAETEFDKAAVKLDLERKRCMVSAGDEKSSFQACGKQFEERLRIAAEKLSLAHDDKKKSTLNLTQEYSRATCVGSPASGSKRKADVGEVQGVSKMPRAGSLNKRDELPAWQWRHSDGTWMDYSDFDSTRIEEARNRRERKCNITVSGLEQRPHVGGAGVCRQLGYGVDRGRVKGGLGCISGP